MLLKNMVLTSKDGEISREIGEMPITVWPSAVGTSTCGVEYAGGSADAGSEDV